MSMYPNEYHDLLSDDNQVAFLVLSFTLADGSPMTAPVWFLADGDSLLLNTSVDALKAKAMRARPNVSAVVMSEENHARYVLVRGTAQQADDVDKVAMYRRMIFKYSRREPKSEVEDSVFFRITPHKVSAFDYSDLEM
jgi:PPOX class probable F420-dependent enzyme